MSTSEIGQSIERSFEYLSAHPEAGRSTDLAVVAVLEEDLRCRATHASGAVVVSDMPPAVGGGGSAPTPGWYMRAALATCDATVIAMCAAQEGVNLTALEVKVDSESDDRGLLGVDDSIPAGPLLVRVHARIASDNATHERLRAIVEWAEQHSPVGDALRRAVVSTTEVEFV